MTSPSVRVVHPEKPEKPVPKEILAEAIVRIGDAAEKLQRDGKLNQKAVVVLLHDATKLPKRDIELILNSLPRLKAWYCR